VDKNNTKGKVSSFMSNVVVTEYMEKLLEEKKLMEYIMNILFSMCEHNGVYIFYQQETDTFGVSVGTIPTRTPSTVSGSTIAEALQSFCYTQLTTDSTDLFAVLENEEFVKTNEKLSRALKFLTILYNSLKKFLSNNTHNRNIMLFCQNVEGDMIYGVCDASVVHTFHNSVSKNSCMDSVLGAFAELYGIKLEIEDLDAFIAARSYPLLNNRDRTAKYIIRGNL